MIKINRIIILIIVFTLLTTTLVQAKTVRYTIKADPQFKETDENVVQLEAGDVIEINVDRDSMYGYDIYVDNEKVQEGGNNTTRTITIDSDTAKRKVEVKVFYANGYSYMDMRNIYNQCFWKKCGRCAIYRRQW